MRIVWIGLVGLGVAFVSTTAVAQEVPATPGPAPTAEASPGKTPAPSPDAPLKVYPAPGAHLGMALPILTIGAAETTTIGSDFVNVGLTPGLTLHLDEKWALDFEFIAFNDLKSQGARTTFVVDPGILRKFDGFVAGLRVATQVGAPTNAGVVPIFVLPFKLSDRSVYFVELDIPLFVRDNGKKPEGSATVLFQTGFGF